MDRKFRHAVRVIGWLCFGLEAGLAGANSIALPVDAEDAKACERAAARSPIAKKGKIAAILVNGEVVVVSPLSSVKSYRFRPDGTFVGSGGAVPDFGNWRAEDGKLCFERSRGHWSCWGQVRISASGKCLAALIDNGQEIIVTVRVNNGRER